MTACRIRLRPDTLDEVRARIAAWPPEVQKELSPSWLERIESGTADAWSLGFTVVLEPGDLAVGQCGFKGPPERGMVELAYGINEDQRGRGYATEAARLMVAFAFSSDDVHLVRAHTVMDGVASGRVLTKCGFRNVGEVIDPDDGRVYRWERLRGDHSPSRKP